MRERILDGKAANQIFIETMETGEWYAICFREEDCEEFQELLKKLDNNFAPGEVSTDTQLMMGLEGEGTLVFLIRKTRVTREQLVEYLGCAAEFLNEASKDKDCFMLIDDPDPGVLH